MVKPLLLNLSHGKIIPTNLSYIVSQKAKSVTSKYFICDLSCAVFNILFVTYTFTIKLDSLK